MSYAILWTLTAEQNWFSLFFKFKNGLKKNQVLHMLTFVQEGVSLYFRVRARVRVSVRVCVCACVRVWVCVYVCVCVRVFEWEGFAFPFQVNFWITIKIGKKRKKSKRCFQLNVDCGIKLGCLMNENLQCCCWKRDRGLRKENYFKVKVGSQSQQSQLNSWIISDSIELKFILKCRIQFREKLKRENAFWE